MGFDLTTANLILKEDYQGPVREQLNNATITLSRLRKTDRNFQGRTAILPLHKGRNVGVGARAESGTLPTAGNQQYDNAKFNVTYQYGRIQLTGPSIAATKTDKGAFIRAVDSEMKGLMKDLKQDLNRQILHNGSSVLGRVATGTASATQTVADTKYFEVGQSVDLYTPSTMALVGTRTVNSKTATTVVLSSSITSNNNDVFVKTGTRTTASNVPLEMWGLEAAISEADPGRLVADTANVGSHGLDQSVVSGQFGQIQRGDHSGGGAITTFWDANVLRNGGTTRPLTTELMQTAFDLIDIASDESPGLIITNHALKRKYGALLVPDKRYPAGGEITLDGGYKALEFNGVPLVADKDANTTDNSGILQAMYFVALNSFEMQVLEDWQWMDKDGSVLSRVSNTDAYEATLYAYMNLGCDQPNANCLLADLLET